MQNVGIVSTCLRCMLEQMIRICHASRGMTRIPINSPKNSKKIARVFEPFPSNTRACLAFAENLKRHPVLKEPGALLYRQKRSAFLT